MDACRMAITKAIAYIERHPAWMRPGVLGTPSYCMCLDAINDAALDGDVEETERACRAWWAYVLVLDAVPKVKKTPTVGGKKKVA